MTSATRRPANRKERTMSSGTAAPSRHDTGSLTVSGKVPAEVPVRSDSQAKIVDSRTLFGDSREIQIVHGSRLYRLRITLNDKLILTA